MICAGAGMAAPSDAVRGGVLRLGSEGLECVIHLRQASHGGWLRAQLAGARVHATGAGPCRWGG
eukprot:COSAG01_NODE_783_length_13630_cov_5.556459_17_plen_64_part_00